MISGLAIGMCIGVVLVLSVIGVIFLYKSFKRKMDETVRKRFISLEKRIIALENVDCRKN
jgi:hypothetical protein